jgi:hypothetical protein
MDVLNMVKSFYSSLLLIVVLAYSAQTHAAPNLLLQCLAKEEEALHKKKASSSLYRLNQEFVNELASSNDINVKKIYVDEICHSKKFSPSIALLRMLLLKEHELYDLSLSGAPASMRPFKMGYINEFQKQVPRIFIQYIAGLQSELMGARCLEAAVPELMGFNEKIKYLEEEITTHQLISQKKSIDSIFHKLRDFDNIKKRCAEQAKRKLDRDTKKAAASVPAQ